MNGTGQYILGLDIGSASIGWACVALDWQGRPESLLRTGVRIFEPGVEGSALDIERGKDQSKAVDRRDARLQRRQLRRRTARQRELFRLLQQTHLLPGEARGASSEARNQIITALDEQIRANYQGAGSASFADLPLYRLRTLALDNALEPHELGRVLFHLSQRRGFKSNRTAAKQKPQQEEDLGQVKREIGELTDLMKNADARTLGEYLAGLDPHTERVRRRWTARAMFEHEFTEIWGKQQEFHPDLLTPALRKEVTRLLFHQRPVGRQEHLVGECELEPGRKRAPWASLAAQQFRVLQKVNDLRVQLPDAAAERSLSMEERHQAVALLNREGSRTFVQIKAHLGLPKESRFNLERSAAKSLPGNRTEQSMRKVFGERWDSFSEGKQNQIVENWRAERPEEEVLAEARGGLGLDPPAAEMLVREQPQDGYCSLSLAALTKLVPLMLEGKSFKEAETEIYGARFAGLPVYDRVPIVRGYLPSLRNPAVERALTEVRKVVNAVLKEHGKPWEVRIELARELKKPRAERAEATVNNRKREAENKKLAERMHRECGLPIPPSRKDLEKAKLFVECGGCCPYTGRSIPFSQLFDNSEFDVEHILPRSRHPDDSFQNKTLCFLPENRENKRNRTPWEAYGSDPERWALILARVAKWHNPGKLKKFKIESQNELEEFSARQLNDTRYSSVLAARLLESLYGGRDTKEQDGTRQVVFVSSGAVTATLRRSWGLEGILQELVSPEPNATRGKPRTDHRHHAIDALTVALTRQGVIQQMARASALEPWQPGTRSWRHVPEPWTAPEFLHGVHQQIEQMLVSHRPEHKVSGELHQGTNYGKPRLSNGKKVVHTRRLLSSLSTSDIESDAIIDPVVRALVQTKLHELGGNPKLFDKPENAPRLQAGPGRTVPIRKVRVQEAKNPLKVGAGPRERWVFSGGIHHVELFVTRDAKRRESWCSRVVQITEAYERLRRKQPVVSRSLEDGEAEFLFSVMKGDTVEMLVQGERRVMRVKKFFETGQIWFVPVNDANPNEVQMKQGIAFSKRPGSLKELRPCKVVVDLLGRVHLAHD